jgi:hypothetical protein
VTIYHVAITALAAWIMLLASFLLYVLFAV